MATIRKDGKAYDSGDVVIAMLGAVESEVSEISYSTEQEHQVNHTLANDATSWSMGKRNHSGTITMMMNCAKKLEKLAGGDLTRLAPFDINVTYINQFNEPVNDTLVCKFTNMGRQVTGEMGLSFQYNLLVLDVAYNNL